MVDDTNDGIINEDRVFTNKKCFLLLFFEKFTHCCLNLQIKELNNALERTYKRIEKKTRSFDQYLDLINWCKDECKK